MQKSEWKNKHFILNSSNDLNFAIYLFTVSFVSWKQIIYIVYRAEICENVWSNFGVLLDGFPFGRWANQMRSFGTPWEL